MPGIIYLLHHKATGREYVGKTTQALALRIKQHARCTIKRYCRELHAAIAAHGIDAFEIVTLAETEEIGKLNELERHFIKARKTLYPAGYNLTTGGDGGTKRIYRPLSEEHKRKLSEAKQRLYASGHVSPSEGYRNSAKIIVASYPKRSRAKNIIVWGKKRDPTIVAKVAAANTGKPHGPMSEEQKAKISAALKGRKAGPLSEEHKAKISASKSGERNPFWGKKRPPEFSAKLSKAMRGKNRAPKSAEHRAKLSAAMKTFKAKQRGELL